MRKLILSFGTAALLACAFLCVRYGLPAYQRYKEARGMRRAFLFIARGDPMNASLSARRVLQANPKNIEACRFMAQLAELARSPLAIDWRRRIVELEPNDANHLELAACGLRLGRPPYVIAAHALENIGATGRGLPGFHMLSAELALRLRRLDEASEHFQLAAQLEPANPLPRLNVAVVNLQSTNDALARQARSDLEQLSDNASLALFALRSLAADSLRQNKLEAAEDFSRKLIHLSGVTLDDRLLRLTILQRLSATGAVQAVTLKNSNGPEFENFLTAVQAQSISNSTAIYSVCQWMGSHGMASQALDWVSALDRSTRATQPVPLAVANLYVAKNDSAALQSFLERENWNDLEFFRLALLARSEWGRNERASGDARWASALRSAGDRLGALIVMTGLADEWGRDPEDILWQIARRFPAEHWALEQLEDRYTASANTRGLNLVYASRLAERRLPLDFTNRNNFASSSLLLGVNLLEAHSIARELYLVRSNDVVIASTYAYSLHLLGKTRDGLNVLARFKPEQLETPAIALYYGTLLCATGDGQQARPYLHAAAKARLLPEETQLLQAAIKSEQARR